MKIRIKSEERNFFFAFPTKLLCSKMVVRIVNHFGRKYAAEQIAALPPEALDRLCAELRRIKDRHGSWELADIESADGETIQVTL